MSLPNTLRTSQSYWLALALTGLLVIAIAVITYWAHQQALLVQAKSIELVRDIYQWAILFIGVLSVGTLVALLHWGRRIIASQEEQLKEQMNYDGLTGLANRSLFWDRLHLTIAQAQRHKQLVAVININIDRFSQINTGLGHHVADQVLQEVANRLRAYTRAGDTIARIAGDDFVIILGDVNNKDVIASTLKRIRKLLSETYFIEEHELNIDTSIGVAVYPVDQNSADKLLVSSEYAMLEAKNSKTGKDVFFTTDMDHNSESSLRQEQELKQAYINNEFVLYYQPKVDSTQGTIKGLEALIRWLHPERGLIPPNEFIPALEASGFINQVGDWVIREACSAIQRWQMQGMAVVPVSVNVAAPQFKQDDFVTRIKDILDTTGVEPGLLELELTESCLMDNVEQSAEILYQLKNLGVSISVDDFGTGYSSLNHLNQFPIDTLKIDRSFITNVNKRKDNDNAGIVTAIMALSHSLRLNVVAEGVETAQELAFLYALGCRTIQGFLFSRPLSEADVIELLRDSQSLNKILLDVRDELNTASG